VLSHAVKDTRYAVKLGFTVLVWESTASVAAARLSREGIAEPLLVVVGVIWHAVHGKLTYKP
jgi:hypothetical protein